MKLFLVLLVFTVCMIVFNHISHVVGQGSDNGWLISSDGTIDIASYTYDFQSAAKCQSLLEDGNFGLFVRSGYDEISSTHADWNYKAWNATNRAFVGGSGNNGFSDNEIVLYRSLPYSAAFSSSDAGGYEYNSAIVAGQVYQCIVTEPGHKYDVKFYYANIKSGTCGTSDRKKILLNIFDSTGNSLLKNTYESTQSITYDPASNVATGWVPNADRACPSETRGFQKSCVYEATADPAVQDDIFTASDNSAMVLFADAYTSAGCDTAVDDVSVKRSSVNIKRYRIPGTFTSCGTSVKTKIQNSHFHDGLNGWTVIGNVIHGSTVLQNIGDESDVAIFNNGTTDSNGDSISQCVATVPGVEYEIEVRWRAVGSDVNGDLIFDIEITDDDTTDAYNVQRKRLIEQNNPGRYWVDSLKFTATNWAIKLSIIDRTKSDAALASDIHIHGVRLIRFDSSVLGFTSLDSPIESKSDNRWYEYAYNLDGGYDMTRSRYDTGSSKPNVKLTSCQIFNNFKRPIIRFQMGSYVDYYKPFAGDSLCDIIQSTGSDRRELWSPDYDSPARYFKHPASDVTKLIGGSESDYPLTYVDGDERSRLPIFGYDGGQNGGCCFSEFNFGWAQPFTIQVADDDSNTDWELFTNIDGTKPILSDYFTDGIDDSNTFILPCSKYDNLKNPVIRLQMGGGVVDYFRPKSGSSICNMLQNYNLHLWAPDLDVSFIEPTYYDNHGGGCAKEWPSNANREFLHDSRHFVSFWGDITDGTRKGGCCTNSKSDTSVNWGQSFKMWITDLDWTMLASHDGTVSSNNANSYANGRYHGSGSALVTPCAQYDHITNPVIKVQMGNVIDYFKPITGQTLCSMLQSNNNHEWSSDGINFVAPSYLTSSSHFGGSGVNWPQENIANDDRKYPSFWGTSASNYNGGCCSYSRSVYTEPDVSWSQPFSIWIGSLDSINNYVYHGDTCTDTTVLNGNFETNLDSWDTIRGSPQITTDSPITGSNSLKLSVSTGDIVKQACVYVPEGYSYALELNVKPMNLAADEVIWLTVSMNDVKKQVFAFDNTLNSVVKQIIFKFTGTAEFMSPQLKITKSSTSSADIIIDDIQIVKHRIKFQEIATLAIVVADITITTDILINGFEDNNNKIIPCSSYDNIAGDLIVKMISAGTQIDYFKPIAGETLCSMLTSYDKHQHSVDGINFFTPSYDITSGILGGSATDWPKNHIDGDARTYLPRWGADAGSNKLGGCCVNSGTSFGVAYKMIIGYMDETKPSLPVPIKDDNCLNDIIIGGQFETTTLQQWTSSLAQPITSSGIDGKSVKLYVGQNEIARVNTLSYKRCINVGHLYDYKLKFSYNSSISTADAFLTINIYENREIQSYVLNSVSVQNAEVDFVGPPRSLYLSFSLNAVNYTDTDITVLIDNVELVRVTASNTCPYASCDCNHDTITDGSITCATMCHTNPAFKLSSKIGADGEIASFSGAHTIDIEISAGATAFQTTLLPSLVTIGNGCGSCPFDKEMFTWNDLSFPEEELHELTMIDKWTRIEFEDYYDALSDTSSDLKIWKRYQLAHFFSRCLPEQTNIRFVSLAQDNENYPSLNLTNLKTVFGTITIEGRFSEIILPNLKLAYGIKFLDVKGIDNLDINVEALTVRPYTSPFNKEWNYKARIYDDTTKMETLWIQSSEFKNIKISSWTIPSLYMKGNTKLESVEIENLGIGGTDSTTDKAYNGYSVVNVVDFAVDQQYDGYNLGGNIYIKENTPTIWDNLLLNKAKRLNYLDIVHPFRFYDLCSLTSIVDYSIIIDSTCCCVESNRLDSVLDNLKIGSGTVTQVIESQCDTTCTVGVSCDGNSCDKVDQTFDTRSGSKLICTEYTGPSFNFSDTVTHREFLSNLVQLGAIDSSETFTFDANAAVEVGLEPFNGLLIPLGKLETLYGNLVITNNVNLKYIGLCNLKNIYGTITIESNTGLCCCERTRLYDSVFSNFEESKWTFNHDCGTGDRLYDGCNQIFNCFSSSASISCPCNKDDVPNTYWDDSPHITTNDIVLSKEGILLPFKERSLCDEKQHIYLNDQRITTDIYIDGDTDRTCDKQTIVTSLPIPWKYLHLRNPTFVNTPNQVEIVNVASEANTATLSYMSATSSIDLKMPFIGVVAGKVENEQNTPTRDALVEVLDYSTGVEQILNSGYTDYEGNFEVDVLILNPISIATNMIVTVRVSKTIKSTNEPHIFECGADSSNSVCQIELLHVPLTNKPIYVSFKDKSTITLSGVVEFGTFDSLSGCRIANATVEVFEDINKNGEKEEGEAALDSTTTNDAGEFQIAVAYGLKNLRLKATYKHHTMELSELINTLSVSDSYTLLDTQKHTLSVQSLQGFCGEILLGTMTAKTTNTCGKEYEFVFDNDFVQSGSKTLDIDVWALDYTFSMSVDSDYSGYFTALGIDKPDALNSDGDVTIAFIYRSEIEANFLRLDDFNKTCDNENYLVVPKEVATTIEIEFYETYNNIACRTVPGYLSVTDNIASLASINIICSTLRQSVGSTGHSCTSIPFTQSPLYYTLIPAEPRLATTSIPSDFVYGNAVIFTFTPVLGIYNDNETVTTTNTSLVPTRSASSKILTNVLVTGAKTIGNAFSLTIPDHVPYLFLYDPPGDGSFASIEKGTVTSTQVSIGTNSDGLFKFGGGGGTKRDFKLQSCVGVGASICKPIPIGEFESKSLSAVKFEDNVHDANSATIYVTHQETISTSSQPLTPGDLDSTATGYQDLADGDMDVMIHLSYVIKFTETKTVSFDADTCTVSVTNGYEWSHDAEKPYAITYKTIWSIKNEIIPTLQQINESLAEDDPKLSTVITAIEGWEATLFTHSERKENSEIWDGLLGNQLRELMKQNNNEVDTQKLSNIKDSLQWRYDAEGLGFASAAAGVIHPLLQYIAEAAVGDVITDNNQKKFRSNKHILTEIKDILANKNYIRDEDETTVSKNDAEDVYVISFDGGGQKFTETIISQGVKDATSSFNIKKAAGSESEPKLTLFAIHTELKTEHEYVVHYSSHEQTSTTHIQVTSFTLADKDVGDYFDVELYKDTVTGIPIFKTRSGRSKCPHEFNTVAREGGIKMYSPPENLKDIPHDKIVSFTIEVENNSPTKEFNEYLINSPLTSNLNGLEITLGGAKLSGSRKLRMNYLEKDTLEFTAARGPVDYDYNVTFVIKSECDPWNIKSSVNVAFSFLQPCASIEWSESDINDMVNQQQNKLVAQIYNPNYFTNDWKKDSNLNEILFQYRLVGSNTWIDESIDYINKVLTAGKLDHYFEPMYDGTYDIRAITKCSLNSMSSTSVRQIKFDRIGPKLLQYPNSVDINEQMIEVEVLFNEEINCNYATTVAANLPLTFVCSGNKMVINIENINDRSAINVQISNIKDMVNNVMVGTKVTLLIKINSNNVVTTELLSSENQNTNSHNFQLLDNQSPTSMSVSTGGSGLKAVTCSSSIARTIKYAVQSWIEDQSTLSLTNGTNILCLDIKLSGDGKTIVIGVHDSDDIVAYILQQTNGIGDWIVTSTITIDDVDATHTCKAGGKVDINNNGRRILLKASKTDCDAYVFSLDSSDVWVQRKIALSSSNSMMQLSLSSDGDVIAFSDKIAGQVQIYTTVAPTSAPSISPSNSPTSITPSPTNSSTSAPSISPSNSPSNSPTSITSSPTNSPTSFPTLHPSAFPTVSPTASPTPSPTVSDEEFYIKHTLNINNVESIALNNDGNRLLVGVANSNEAQLFEYDGSLYTKVRTFTHPEVSDKFGSSVDINYDGTSVLISGTKAALYVQQVDESWVLYKSLLLNAAPSYGNGASLVVSGSRYTLVLSKQNGDVTVWTTVSQQEEILPAVQVINDRILKLELQNAETKATLNQILSLLVQQ